MITGLISAKHWKKWAAIAVSGIASVAGITCIGVQAVSNWKTELDTTAQIAAGCILPDGALYGMLQSATELEQTGEPSEASEDAASASSPAPAASSGNSGTADSEPSAAASSQSSIWSGTPSPIVELTLPNAGLSSGAVFVKNTNENTTLNVAEELERQPDLSIQKDGSPQVLIYHTHTSESYLTEESDTFYSDMPTRSDQAEETVAAVGEAIAAELRAAGIGVIHDTTVHDSSYNGSYSRSAETIAADLEAYPTIQITLDIHRDAMIAEDGTHYKPTVTVNGKKAAQIMIISGCDDDGSLNFPDWEYNLRFALRLQQSCAEWQENFARPLSFCPHNYNLSATHNSLLIEVGTESNTIEEAVYAGTLLGQRLVAVLESTMA